MLRWTGPNPFIGHCMPLWTAAPAAPASQAKSVIEIALRRSLFIIRMFYLRERGDDTGDLTAATHPQLPGG